MVAMIIAQQIRFNWLFLSIIKPQSKNSKILAKLKLSERIYAKRYPC
jgi:hypothetical protein